MSDDFRISQNYDSTSKAFSKFDTTFVSLSSVGKALDGRPRPQKQLSQPTLGASEHMEAGRLRGSQSSEGSELIHSMSVNTSSPNSGTFNSDTSRDTDMGKLQLHQTHQQKTEREMVSNLLLVSQVGLRPQAPPG